MKKLLLLILSISFTSLSFAQLSDLHYLPPLKQHTYNTDYGIQTQRIYLSTPNPASFTVNVYQGSSNTIVKTFSISKGTSASWDLPSKSSADGDNNITFVKEANTGVKLTSSGLRFESVNGEEFYVNLRGNSGSHGSSLTSKGRAALGKAFKWGGVPNLRGNPTNATLGLMATQDSTIVNISGYDPNTTFRLGSNMNGITSDQITVLLNAGESYVLESVISTNNNSTSKEANKDGWLGASIISNKNIAVSVGEFLFQPSATGTGQDSGMDQIIPENVLGKEYVFVRGYSNDNNVETAVILATQNNTQIFINDSNTPIGTIDNGEYYQVKGQYYSGLTACSIMFVRASKEVYAFQSLSAQDTRQADLNFIAPVNFLLDKEVDYIPRIDEVSGTTTIQGGITIISSKSTPIDSIQVLVNSVRQSLTGKRKSVTGSDLWETYFLDGLTGDVSVKSSGSIAVGYVGRSGVIGVSGYFSGFETIPSIEVTVQRVGECLQNGNVSLSAPQDYSIYQWYLEGNPVAGATQSTLVPTLPGSYTVGITQSADGKEYVSAPVDVSDCLPEVKLDVTSNVQSLSVGESTTLRVNYKYQSFFSATNAKVNLTIPSNFQVAANSPSVGTWDASTKEWTIGGVSPGNEEVIELTLTALSIGNPVVVSALNSQTVLGSDNTTVLSEGGAISDDLTESFIIKNATVINAVTPLSKTILDADFSLGATSPNSNPITYSSSNEGVVKVDGNGLVEIISVGTATITLNQLASETYGPGTKDVVVTVSKVTPTLTAFLAINKTYGDPNFQLTAPNSTGDGTFSYTSSNTSVATVNSSTGEITIVGVGSATITATQAATSNYNAQSIQATLTVSPADQIISVGSLPDGKTILELVGPGGDNSPISVTATSTSGVPVTITATFDSSTSQTGTFSSNILSSVSGAGILVFDFTVSASTNYNAASTSVSLDVSKRPQNINSSSMPLSAVYQENLRIPLVASSLSSSAMVYTVVSGPATIVSGELVISGTGVVTYKINNSGDNTYATAPEVTKELEITQGSTTLSSFSISDKTYGDASFSIPIPSSTRTGTFVYSSNNPAVASIVGGNIQVNTPGTVTITATQPSTSNWTTGTINTTFNVLKATPVFSGSTALSKLTIDSDFNYPLTSSIPSNPIVYRSSDLSVATVNSSTGLISIEGIGTASITATQAATTNYNAASATLTLTVAKANPTLGMLSAQTKSINDSNFILAAPSSNSGGTFSFSSSDTGVVTINSVTGEVSIVGLGTSTITINQAATASYNVGSTSVTITVRSPNSAPTAVALSASTVAENAVSGTTIGTLSATDVDAGDTFTYTLVSGTGSTDNASFSISGSTLKTAGVFDFETKASYSVRVRVTDTGGLTFERELTITVTDENEDRDGDGVKDNEERVDDTDPLDACSFTLASQNSTPSDAWKVADCDGDGLTNQQEKELATDLFRVDTDVDGVKDRKEIEDKTDPRDPCSLVVEHQTEQEGIQYWDSLDCDGDGVSNENEIR
uniref:Ig-like domain-containing protein n=1 Tax=Flavobacterium sp. TaxID=239 RepID=UPI00404A5C55